MTIIALIIGVPAAVAVMLVYTIILIIQELNG